MLLLLLNCAVVEIVRYYLDARKNYTLSKLSEMLSQRLFSAKKLANHSFTVSTLCNFSVKMNVCFLPSCHSPAKYFSRFLFAICYPACYYLDMGWGHLQICQVVVVQRWCSTWRYNYGQHYHQHQLLCSFPMHHQTVHCKYTLFVKHATFRI